jgi:hypothetical protein
MEINSFCDLGVPPTKQGALRESARRGSKPPSRVLSYAWSVPVWPGGGVAGRRGTGVSHNAKQETAQSWRSGQRGRPRGFLLQAQGGRGEALRDSASKRNGPIFDEISMDSLTVFTRLSPDGATRPSRLGISVLRLRWTPCPGCSRWFDKDAPKCRVPGSPTPPLQKTIDKCPRRSQKPSAALARRAGLPIASSFFFFWSI